MKVRFDLRPASLLERERKKHGFNLLRLFAVLLLLAFVAANGFYIATVTLSVLQLKSEIEIGEQEVADLEITQRALEAEIGRLRAEEKVYVDTLKIMQDELPVLEVLQALETHMSRGMGIASLKFAPPRTAGAASTATFVGTAPTDAQVITFMRDLDISDVFSGVRMPTSTRDEKTGRVSFTLDLLLKPIGEIGAPPR